MKKGADSTNGDSLNQKKLEIIKEKRSKTPSKGVPQDLFLELFSDFSDSVYLDFQHQQLRLFNHDCILLGD